ncbi:MAG: acyltransferase [Nitrosomonadales bacterium]|nr:acyltransferase [Nitrosomonadales bacterium]
MSKGLTTFRALAFFAIFLFHINGHFRILGGYLGVQAFFVLSGFLLTPILLEMKAGLTTKDFFVHFYGRRALRIFPLYYSYLLIVAAISTVAISHYGQGVLLQLERFVRELPWTMTYTYDFYHASNFIEHTYLATHFWSLAVEEQFYLVWPLAIFLIPAHRFRRFLLWVIVAGPFMRFALAIISDANVLPSFPKTDIFVYVLPFSHVDAFAIGGYFALYGKSRQAYLVWLYVAAVLMVGVLTSWIFSQQVQWGQLGYGPFMADSYKHVWGYTLVNLMFAYVLVHIRDRAFLPVFFENPVLVYLGTISYGLYVFHYPVLGFVYKAMYGFPDIVQVLSALLITIMVSAISYEFVEKRFIGAKDKYFARGAGRTA